MPQWDFLDFLAEHGKRYPAFDLRMRAEATDLIEEGGRVVGVRAKTPDGELEIRADLVVGCDGRHSTRARARRLQGGGHRRADGRDVVPRCRATSNDGDEVFGHIESGRMLVMLNRNDYWQCAYRDPERRHRRGAQAAASTHSATTVGDMSPFDVATGSARSKAGTT